MNLYNYSSEPTFLDAYAYVGYGLFKIGLFCYDTCIYISNTPTFQSMFVTALIMYGRFATYVEQHINHMYDTEPQVKVVIDNYNWMLNKYRLLTTRTKQEPDCENWTNICKTQFVNDEYQLFESYGVCNDVSQLSVCLNQEYGDVAITKFENVYYIRQDGYDNVIFSKEPVLSPFISISYSHPLLEEDIELSIPSSMFRNGNQLFNFSFVHRCIQYSSESDVPFDRNYKIKLMDSNVVTHIIESHQYLEMEQNTFSIKNIESD